MPLAFQSLKKQANVGEVSILLCQNVEMQPLFAPTKHSKTPARSGSSFSGIQSSKMTAQLPLRRNQILQEAAGHRNKPKSVTEAEPRAEVTNISPGLTTIMSSPLNDSPLRQSSSPFMGLHSLIQKTLSVFREALHLLMGQTHEQVIVSHVAGTLQGTENVL